MMRHDVADANAHRAVEAPVDGALLVITGPAASGKTETLARRYATIVTRDPSIGLGDTIVSAGGEGGASALADRIRPLLDATRATEFDRDARYAGVHKPFEDELGPLLEGLPDVGHAMSPR